MMKLMKMEATHVPQVAELEKLCFQDPWSEASVALELENELAHWLVCLVDDRVVGYVGSQTVMGETDMMNIGVHPDYRRHHVAAALLQKLLEDLRALGSHSLTLEVRSSNRPAAGLYDSFGFSQVGLRKNYYQNPKEDARILRKEWEL